MKTRATTYSEIVRQRQIRAERLTWAKWFTGSALVIALLVWLVGYCRAEVEHVQCYLAAQDIHRDLYGRSLRIAYDEGIKSAAESAVAGCENFGGETSSFNSPASMMCGGPTPAAELAYPVFLPTVAAGDVTAATLSSADLWASDDSTTRRDFIAEHFMSYGLSSEEAALVADVCIEFAQCNGADLFFTVGTVTAESGGNRHAVNRSSGCTGLWQIHPVHKKRMARLGLDFGTEEGRTAMAHVLYSESGWKPWAPSRRNAQRIARKLEAAWNSKDRGD